MEVYSYLSSHQRNISVDIIQEFRVKVRVRLNLQYKYKY